MISSRMSLDLNLLVALDALLAEGSVVGAAQKLGLSPSAMSRTLARLRGATDDPLLVRAGRTLVPTPHAEALSQRLPDLLRDVQAVLRPAAKALDLAVLERTFTLRTNEAFAQVFAARLVVAVTNAAPRVRLRFAPKPDRDVSPLREGAVDLEIGVLSKMGPEVRVQGLFIDQHVGAVRSGHPILSAKITPKRFAAYGHVVVSHPNQTEDPVSKGLEALGLARNIVVTAPSFPAAIAIARASDLVAQVTDGCLGSSTRTGPTAALSQTVEGFELPLRTPPIAISQMWHPRLEADPAHRWLRGLVLSVCRKRSAKLHG